MKINEISENISHTSKRLRDIEREKKVKPGTDDWFKLWFSLPYLKESSGNSYMLQLERDNRAGMLVLHILNKQTGKRTEVRGKLGYETNGYDPEDKLHQLLDKIGKSASVSDLMNGDVVSINPRHPQGPAALKVAHDLTNEAKENIYDILEPEDCGPFDGGCVLVAQALQKIHGGDIVVLINDRGNADHAAVKLGNTLIDYDGPLPVEKFIKRFEKNEHVKIKGIRPMKDSDLPEATRNQSLLPKIVNLLSKGVKEAFAVEPDVAGYQHTALTNPQYTIVVNTPGELDWYKIGQHFANLGKEDPHEYGQAESDMMIVAPNKEQLIRYMQELDRIGAEYKVIGGSHEHPEIHNESNVFTDARMNAIKAGKKEFSVNGKTYKVTGDIKDELEAGTNENFADGKNPGRKGLAKRMGVNTKASVSSLRKTAKNSSGEKQRMAHWLANMKAGKQRASETIVEFDEEDEIYYSKKLAPVAKKLFQTMYPEAKVKAVEDGDGYLSIETTDGVFGFSIGVTHQYGDNVISVGNAYAGSYKGVVGQLVKAAAELLQKKHPDGETTLVAQHDVSDNYWPQLANKLGINYENNAW
jgi:hypothetical protein